MHVKVNIVYKETFSNRRISVCIRINVEPDKKTNQLETSPKTYLISSSISGQLFYVISSSLSVKIDDIAQSVSF